jgi:hypothetical protein
MFNKPLDTWITKNVKDMEAMFMNASTFDQDISNWNINKVRNMRAMFSGATNFSKSLNKWDLNKVRKKIGILDGTNNLKDEDYPKNYQISEYEYIGLTEDIGE